VRSIRRQLNWTVLTAIAMLEAAGLLATYGFVRAALVRQVDDNLLTKAQAVSTPVTRDADRVRVNFSDRFLRGFDDEEAEDFFELWERDGSVISRSKTLGKSDLPRRGGSVSKPCHWSLTLPNGRPGRAVGFEFKPRRGESWSKESGPVAPVQIVVATDREDLDEILGQVIGVIAGVGGLILAATGLIVPRMLRRGLRPLDALADRAALIDARSLAVRFEVRDLPEELQAIAARLNDLLARLEASFARERRVSADLAHELRTPLAELRMLGESALKWPDERDPSTDRETVAIANHMEAIVQLMLMLARTENGQIELKREHCDLARLAEDAWRPFAARAAAKQLQVSFDLRPLEIATDPTLWRAILSNLYDNAVDYTPAGGAIEVHCVPNAPGPLVRVQNETQDIDPGEVAKFFERFWRKEAARSGGQHLGLGLSLVRAFADALGWTIVANLNERKSLSLVLTERKGTAADER
jgi:signal transduction histidine kinase